jgi:hypothetical protein
LPAANLVRPRRDVTSSASRVLTLLEPSQARGRECPPPYRPAARARQRRPRASFRFGIQLPAPRLPARAAPRVEGRTRIERSPRLRFGFGCVPGFGLGGVRARRARRVRPASSSHPSSSLPWFGFGAGSRVRVGFGSGSAGSARGLGGRRGAWVRRSARGFGARPRVGSSSNPSSSPPRFGASAACRGGSARRLRVAGAAPGYGVVGAGAQLAGAGVTRRARESHCAQRVTRVGRARGAGSARRPARSARWARTRGGFGAASRPLRSELGGRIAAGSALGTALVGLGPELDGLGAIPPRSGHGFRD